MSKQSKNKRGKYLGQCRMEYNILQQWDGKVWREVPDVITPVARASKIHFDVEDALHD